MKTATELDIPVRSWVPDIVAVVVVFIIMLPIVMLNGTYTGSMIEVSSTLGVYTEDITIGYYAAAAGMAIAYPIAPKIAYALSNKSLLLIDLILQLLLSWFCAYQSNIELVIACSFVVGFLKGFLMLWIIRRIKIIFSPKDIRSEFYAYFYPIVFGGGQLSMVITALLAYHYDWKYMYYFMMLLLLFAILAVIVFFRHDRSVRPIAWGELHPRELIVSSTSILMLIYVITYGKVLDWMASTKICAYIVIGPLLFSLFLWKQFNTSHPFVSLRPLLKWRTILGYLYMMLVMFLNSSSSLFTSYMMSILRTDSTRTYTLYIWLIPGYIVGGIVCFWWFRLQKWRFRYLVGLAMGCFALCFGIMYFGVSPYSTYEMLYLPVFLRGFGMIVLIIAFALYAVEGLPPQYLLSNAFFLICFRSVLSPVGGSAFYSNMLYHLQQKNIVRIADSLSATSTMAMSRWKAAFANSFSHGYGMNDATKMATRTLYSIAQQQSTLLALKQIFFWLFIVTLVISILSIFIPFYRTIRIPTIQTGEDMV